MNVHSAMVDRALEEMSNERKEELGKAAEVISSACGISRKELVEIIAQAQKGSPFTPKFEAELLVMQETENAEGFNLVDQDGNPIVDHEGRQLGG